MYILQKCLILFAIIVYCKSLIKFLKKKIIKPPNKTIEICLQLNYCCNNIYIIFYIVYFIINILNYDFKKINNKYIFLFLLFCSSYYIILHCHIDIINNNIS